MLCSVQLQAVAHHGIQRHPQAATCRVRYTDAFGVCLTDEEALIADTIADEPPEPQGPPESLFDLHPPVEWVLGELFASFGLPRLGGISTGKGWSGYAAAQRCLYLWRKRYIERQSGMISERRSLAIGTLVHTLLALHYANQLKRYTEITPQVCHDYLITRANPELVREGWRVFQSYRLYYAYDPLQPLAVEYDLKDPRTGESCRYDLIGYYSKPSPGRVAGTYVFEHKTSERFDFDTLEGWAGDGEVIGEAALWRRLGLDKRFGPLRGVVINILGKQQEPKFHRTTVAPSQTLIDAHFDDLRRWDGLLALCKASNNFPRSRANCIGRYGRCDWWEHCATGAP